MHNYRSHDFIGVASIIIILLLGNFRLIAPSVAIQPKDNVKQYSHVVRNFSITVVVKEMPLSMTIVGFDNTNKEYYKAEEKNMVEWLTFADIDKIFKSDPNFAKCEGDVLKIKWYFYPIFSLSRVNQEDLGGAYLLSRINKLTTRVDSVEQVITDANAKRITDLTKAVNELKRIHYLKYAIKFATISAKSLCKSCRTSVFQSQLGGRHAYSLGGSYMTFKLQKVEQINFIEFHLYDGNGRTYTYNVDYSLDGIQWTEIRENQQGKGYQSIRTGDIKLQWLRLRGWNTDDYELHIYYLRIDFI